MRCVEIAPCYKQRCLLLRISLGELQHAILVVHTEELDQIVNSRPLDDWTHDEPPPSNTALLDVTRKTPLLRRPRNAECGIERLCVAFFRVTPPNVSFVCDVTMLQHGERGVTASNRRLRRRFDGVLSANEHLLTSSYIIVISIYLTLVVFSHRIWVVFAVHLYPRRCNIVTSGVAR